MEDIKKHLRSPDLIDFGFSVAFAKVGPFYRLAESLDAWRKEGKHASGIFGIDHNGTSVQALRFALERLDAVYYTVYPGHTFHPKIYWFQGNSKGIAIIGSNNLTTGGMELNFESAVQLEFELPAERDDFSHIQAMFTSLLPDNCVATQTLTFQALDELEAQGLLLDESLKVVGAGTVRHRGANLPANRPKLPVRPASSIPPRIAFGRPPRKKALELTAQVIKAQAEAVDVLKPFVPVAGLAIQINPHPNGEIFLSTIAINQNPAFFGMPFTGQTKPKKGENEGYPQRVPDPICSIAVFGQNNELLYSNPAYPLNTVFYTRNKEIRVTASPLVGPVPEYSVLVMTLSHVIGIDYDLQVFRPDSPDYKKWLDVCNQQMPSGGKPVARRFGWF